MVGHLEFFPLGGLVDNGRRIGGGSPFVESVGKLRDIGEAIARRATAAVVNGKRSRCGAEGDDRPWCGSRKNQGIKAEGVAGEIVNAIAIRIVREIDQITERLDGLRGQSS